MFDADGLRAIFTTPISGELFGIKITRFAHGFCGPGVWNSLSNGPRRMILVSEFPDCLAISISASLKCFGLSFDAAKSPGRWIAFSKPTLDSRCTRAGASGACRTEFRR
jgi:hypothetical protein